MNPFKRNLALLVAAQGLLSVSGTTLLTVNALAGLAVAPTRWLATAPVTAYVVGAALASAPVGWLTHRIGRRATFLTGAIVGAVGMSLCVVAVQARSFALLCIGTVVAGGYNAAGQLYRFAAADVVPPERRERAISLVLAGGLLGAIVGPNLARLSKDWLSVTFAGSYASLVAVGLVAMMVIAGLRFAARPPGPAEPSGRSIRVILTDPRFVVAALMATVSWGVMNLLMTGTPIAMKACDHSFASTTFVLEWHLIGMFAPGFVTGSLIRRLGLVPIMLTGVGLMAASVAIGMSGVDLTHFFGALVALGIGWNFMFVGATALLTKVHAPGEKARVQSTNDFLVFVTMAASSLASGLLITTEGWRTLNLAAIPFLLVAALATLRWRTVL